MNEIIELGDALTGAEDSVIEEFAARNTLIKDGNPLISAFSAFDYLQRPEAVLVESYNAGDISKADLQNRLVSSGVYGKFLRGTSVYGSNGYYIGKKKRSVFSKAGKALTMVWKKAGPVGRIVLIGAAVYGGYQVVQALLPKDPVKAKEAGTYIQAGATFDPSLKGDAAQVDKMMGRDNSAIAQKQQEISTVGWDNFKKTMADSMGVVQAMNKTIPGVNPFDRSTNAALDMSQGKIPSDSLSRGQDIVDAQIKASGLTKDEARQEFGATAYSTGTADNTMLYIGIGAGTLVLIGGVVLFLRGR